MNSPNNITLAILAGGKAQRMGGINKGLIKIDGETILKRIYLSLSPLFIETIIIGDPNKNYSLPGIKIYEDIIQNAGPLGGIHSALKNSSNNFVFVVSCDMPFVDSAIAIELIENLNLNQTEILIPKIRKFIEPLFAIYSKNTIPKIEEIIQHGIGRPITDLIEKTNTKYLVLDDNPANNKCFTNINTLEDLKRISNT